MYMKNDKIYLQTSVDAIRAYLDPNIDWYKTDLCPKVEVMHYWLATKTELNGFNESINHWNFTNVRKIEALLILLNDYNQPLVLNAPKLEKIDYLLLKLPKFDSQVVINAPKLRAVDSLLDDLDVFNQPVDGIPWNQLEDITGCLTDCPAFDQGLESVEFTNAKSLHGIFDETYLRPDDLKRLRKIVIDKFYPGKLTSTILKAPKEAVMAYIDPDIDWSDTNLSGKLSELEWWLRPAIGGPLDPLYTFNESIDHWDFSNITKTFFSVHGLRNFDKEINISMPKLRTMSHSFGYLKGDKPINIDCPLLHKRGKVDSLFREVYLGEDYD